MTESPQAITLDNIRIERPIAEVTDQDVDEMLVTLRRQRREWRPADRAARQGDRVVIDYRGSIAGKSFPGANGTRLPVVLGSSDFLPAFEAGLVGCRPGESRMVKVEFPADYSVSALAGKPATYEVKIHSIAEEFLPPLDEDFVKKFGIPSGNVADLRRDVEANMRNELSQTLKVLIKNQVMDALLENNPQSPPLDMIEQEIDQLFQKAKAEATDGARGTGAGLTRELFREQGRRRVSLGAILSAIASQEAITLDYARVHNIIEADASSFEDQVAAARIYYEDPDRMRQIETVALEDQMVEWVLARVAVVERPTSFRAIMGLDAPRTSATS
jgi:trigger factor